MVSTLTISFITFSMLFAVSLPIVLAIVFKKKFKTSLLAFFVGCGVWFVFAIVLEQIMHTLVLASSLGATIQNNIWLYGIYGGLAAGVFEETGRFIAMKTLLKKTYDNPHNSLMYGAGHGGFEAFFLLGTGMLNNLIYALMINAGQIETLLAPLDGAQRESVQVVIDSLIKTKSYIFLLGDFERISAVILHISLSVLVWIAVVKGKYILYPLAIFIHFFVNAVTVIINGYNVSVIVLEGIVFVLSVLAAVIAYKFWKLNDMNESTSMNNA